MVGNVNVTFVGICLSSFFSLNTNFYYFFRSCFDVDREVILATERCLIESACYGMTSILNAVSKNTQFDNFIQEEQYLTSLLCPNFCSAWDIRGDVKYLPKTHVLKIYCPKSCVNGTQRVEP